MTVRIEPASALADYGSVRRMSGGDATALAELYDRHGGAVYGLAVRILRDAAEAEEVVQDVFLHAWKHAARYDEARASVTGWLLMMARSRAIDCLRARQSRPGHRVAAGETDLIHLADTGRGQESVAIVRESAERLTTALRDLPETMRVALELAYYEGLTQAAIAARLGEPLGTVKTRMRTGLSKLRAALERGEVS